MNEENTFGESAFYKGLEIKEKKDEIETIKLEIEKVKEKLAQHSGQMAERKEILTIINGLSKKLDELIDVKKEKSKGMPETDEEWKELLESQERIDKIHVMIADLYLDLDDLDGKMTTFEDDVDETVSQIQRALNEVKI